MFRMLVFFLNFYCSSLLSNLKNTRKMAGLSRTKKRTCANQCVPRLSYYPTIVQYKYNTAFTCNERNEEMAGEEGGGDGLLEGGKKVIERL